MADEDKQSKTEKPTAKKLQSAREKGNIPRSKELASTVSLMVAMFALYATGGFMFDTLKGSTREILGRLATTEVTATGVYALMLRLFLTFGMVVLPFLIMVVGIGLVANLSQGGLVFSTEKISFNLGRMNPLSGAKRIFNTDSLVETVKSFLKIVIVTYMAYRIMRDEISGIIYLVDDDLPGIVRFIGHLSYKLVIHTGGVMLILAVLDLAFVRWRFMQDLKMTKQEVKDEHKEAEGNPEVKKKLRSLQFQRAMRRLTRVIPQADVVVTNPTHFAVALKYDRERMAAPVVIAKGVDFLAQRIKALARENNVTLVENRFLARELYAQVKEGEEIPESLYAAVAEILAYVYGLKGKR